jgi:hypothetical protein
VKKSESINTVILDNLRPTGHSFGLLHADSIVHKIEWHQHNEYELLFMERAYGTFLIGDHVFSCSESDDSLLLFFGKNLPHSFYYENTIATLPKKVSTFSLFLQKDALGKGSLTCLK